MRKLLSRLEHTSKPAITLLAVCVTALLAIIDFATGPELHFMFFYLFPIALTSWFVNQRGGILIAVLCAVTWLFADYLGGRRYSSELVTMWNLAMRTAVSVVIAWGIGRLRSMFDKLSELANRDFLTGLPNGRAFYQLAADEMERAFGLAPMTLAIVDVEGFKWINHRFGYVTGDQMLCTIAHAIRASVPQSELVGRIGGTSFAILLPNANSEEARFILERLQRTLKDERRRYAQPVTFFISAIACTRAPRKVAELMHEAELRMARMKNGGHDTLEIALVNASPPLN